MAQKSASERRLGAHFFFVFIAKIRYIGRFGYDLASGSAKDCFGTTTKTVCDGRRKTTGKFMIGTCFFFFLWYNWYYGAEKVLKNVYFVIFLEVFLMSEVVGIEKITFTKKSTGEVVTALRIYLTSDLPSGNGKRCEEVFVTFDRLGNYSPALGDMVFVQRDTRGFLQAIVKV